MIERWLFEVEEQTAVDAAPAAVKAALEKRGKIMKLERVTKGLVRRNQAEGCALELHFRWRRRNHSGSPSLRPCNGSPCVPGAAHTGGRCGSRAHRWRLVMLEEAVRVEIADVEVLDYGNLVMRCRVGDRVVWVPSLRVLTETTIQKRGDRGRLVLPHDLAIELGLA
jgi:hypothetical protein